MDTSSESSSKKNKPKVLQLVHWLVQGVSDQKKKRNIERKARDLRSVMVIALGFGFLHLNPGSRQALLAGTILDDLRGDLARDKRS